jgi:hypothetical protein
MCLSPRQPNFFLPFLAGSLLFFVFISPFSLSSTTTTICFIVCGCNHLHRGEVSPTRYQKPTLPLFRSQRKPLMGEREKAGQRRGGNRCLCDCPVNETLSAPHVAFPTMRHASCVRPRFYSDQRSDDYLLLLPTTTTTSRVFRVMSRSVANRWLNGPLDPTSVLLLIPFFLSPFLAFFCVFTRERKPNLSLEQKRCSYHNSTNFKGWSSSPST